MAIVEKELIKFLQIRPGNRPARAHEHDAGIDFFVPEFNSAFIEDLIGKNKKTFKTLDDEPQEIQKFHPENFVGDFTLSGSGSAVWVDAGSGSKNPKNHPQDFFGFDIEIGEPYLILSPGEGVMIPSGFKSRMANPGRALIAANKSGVATKHKLTYGAQVVDYTYKGEIHLHLINNSNEDVKIYQNQKILQFLETPVFTSEVEVTDTTDPIVDAEGTEKNFYEGLQDDRKDGGFGSTDDKK